MTAAIAEGAMKQDQRQPGFVRVQRDFHTLGRTGFVHETPSVKQHVASEAFVADL